MSRRRLRFIHSSDWHLERPLGGLAQVRPRLDLRGKLGNLFADATYLAAEKVVSAALAEQADFVVLAGDILDVELAGPRGAAFLIRQFERLAHRQIPVYWAAGRVDRPQQWPAALRLPDNVFRFSGRRPEAFDVDVDGRVAARVIGANRPRGGKIRATDFWADPDGLPTIAVTQGRADRQALPSRGLTYWALGGRHSRAAILEGLQAAQYSGSPQARRPDETSTHGCTLVELDEEGRLHTRSLATEVVRFCRRRVTVGESTTLDDLENRLADQAHELRSSVPDVNLLVSWSVGGSGPLVAAMRRGDLASQILARLDRRLEQETPIVCGLSIELEPEAAVPPVWSEQDSLLGDFLRSLAQFDGTHDPTDLVGPVEQMVGEGRKARRLARVTDADRRRVLQMAAAIGADLLAASDAARPHKEGQP
ncbi:MAG TPA: DNA repair exonuclease [Pirellulales bacterium]|nr:DNA repair exonuclease [Pirellulales bacterium]